MFACVSLPVHMTTCICETHLNLHVCIYIRYICRCMLMLTFTYSISVLLSQPSVTRWAVGLRPVAFNLADMSRLCIISYRLRKRRTCRKNAGSLYANIWPWLVRAHPCPCDNRGSKETERVIQKERCERGREVGFPLCFVSLGKSTSQCK